MHKSNSNTETLAEARAGLCSFIKKYTTGDFGDNLIPVVVREISYMLVRFLRVTYHILQTHRMSEEEKENHVADLIICLAMSSFMAVWVTLKKDSHA